MKKKNQRVYDYDKDESSSNYREDNYQRMSNIDKRRGYKTSESSSIRTRILRKSDYDKDVNKINFRESTHKLRESSYKKNEKYYASRPEKVTIITIMIIMI